jgi:hypothetical protein
VNSCFRVFQSTGRSPAEKRIPLMWLLPMGVTQARSPDFHGFLLDHALAMWIWLESREALGDDVLFAHAHQISVLVVHSLWSGEGLYPSLLARYPKLPQASATTSYLYLYNRCIYKKT